MQLLAHSACQRPSRQLVASPLGLLPQQSGFAEVAIQSRIWSLEGAGEGRDHVAHVVEQVTGVGSRQGCLLHWPRGRGAV